MEDQIFTMFSYAAFRRDFFNGSDRHTLVIDKNGNKWTQDFWRITLDADCDYAYVKGFSMWQDREALLPSVTEKSDANKYVVYGTTSTWKQQDWPEALKRINRITEYDENNPKSQFKRKITTIYQDRLCTIPKGKAYIYHQILTSEILATRMSDGSPRFSKEKDPDFFKWSTWESKQQDFWHGKRQRIDSITRNFLD